MIRSDGERGDMARGDTERDDKVIALQTVFFILKRK